jgi:hypothetical protein
MKAAILLAGLSLAAAGTALAADRVTDVDYLRAARCKGLAEGLGGDATGLTAFLKANGKVREAYILERGDAEAFKAKKEAKGDRRERAQAELAGPCAAFTGPGQDVAAAGKATTAN